MGRPKNTESCPYGDNACWLPGKTPRYLYGTVEGVTVPSWVVGGAPNGDYTCQQVSSTRWVSTGSSRMAIVVDAASLRITVYNILNQPVFSGFQYGYCLRALAGSKTAYNTIPGKAAFGYAGPYGSNGNHEDLASQTGILHPPTAQFEYHAAFDNNPRVRIAQKLDHTCVHIKILNVI